ARCRRWCISEPARAVANAIHSRCAWQRPGRRDRSIRTLALAYGLLYRACVCDVELSGIRKQYDVVARPVIHALDLLSPARKMAVLVGPSGCGKSTTLRMVAGLEEPTAGTITMDGRDVTHLPPAERDIAMVFQSYALYPSSCTRRPRSRSAC